ncbi:MAG: 1-acyl-sn-glycerol-3-phosphate acyltransferase [Alphaproteobacteria bacterium]|nr:1-acyl-sn-glycerol-3-phosphate acyltransferase [Alphaproteobacteria bacterium]
MGSPFRAFRRLTLYAGLTVALLPLQILFLCISRQLASTLPRLYHRLCCGVLGLDVEVIGTPPAAQPALYAANHSSYLDVAALGAAIQGSFVAKIEVGRWPIHGFLTRLQRTVLIDRRRMRVGNARAALAERLAQGDRLVLFPEGTSSDGMRVMPFKSGCFAAVPGDAIVQPVTIAYVRLDGVPLDDEVRPLVTWFGAMTLAPHVWRMAGLGWIGVRLQFHQPVRPADFLSRKALTRHCQTVIAGGLAEALADRRARSAIDAENEDQLGLLALGRISI